VEKLNGKKMPMSLYLIFLTFVRYVAAKSNYFGVGGGTRDFESFVLKGGKFNVETCHTVETGVSFSN
jgi:hypothetical protein